MGQHTAGEERAKLLLDELRQAGALGTTGRLAEKGFPARAHDGAEDTALRLAGW